MQERAFLPPFRGWYRASLRATVLGPLLLGALAWPGSAQTLRRPPASTRVFDVLLVVLDDVAAADLALYGGAVDTPHLARLASEGVLFTNAYANPVCKTTRRSLQYGRWWLRGNGDDCTPTVSPDTPPLGEPSLAEALPGQSAAFFGKWHLGAVPGGGDWECAALARGYEHWLAGIASNVSGDLLCRGSLGYREWLRVEAGPGGCSSSVSLDYLPRAQIDAFVSSWPTLASPRLACVNPNLAHAPFHRPPQDLLPVGYPPTSTNRERFEAMIRALDTSLGRMLAGVDLEDTLVVVVSDNGTPDIVAPEPARAKNTTFERGIRVPLIIAGGPTAKGGRASAELVHVVDLWSTIVEAGGGNPASATSRSLLPILRDLPHARIREFALSGTRWDSPQGDRCAISHDGFKLRQLDTDGDEIADVEELYDLGADPDERVNLIDRLPVVASAMRTWLTAEAP
jgi:arylsulfatase A-like enzyme